MNIKHKYERQLISRMLSDKQAYSLNSDIIRPELFTKYREVAETYIELVANGKHPGLTKIITLLPAYEEDIIRMSSNVDYEVPVEDLVSELEEHSRMQVLGEAITISAYQKTSEERIKTLTDAIMSFHEKQKTTYRTGYEIGLDMIKEMQSTQKTGVPTGFGFLDKLTGGLQPSDLVIVAAETSQGKTSLALNIAHTAARLKHPVAFISLEMSSKQLIGRIVSSEVNRSKKEVETDYALAEQGVSELKELPFYVADVTNNSTQHIAGLIRAAHLRYGIKVAFIDYLQLMGDKSKQSREQEIGQTARTLKNVAKELNINVVALSQLRRPSHGGNHFPSLSRLRDSGQVEEAADVVLFVYRPEMYGISEYEDQDTNGLAQLIIAKGRNYGVGKFFVEFQAETTTFIDRDYRGVTGNNPPLTKVEGKLPF